MSSGPCRGSPCQSDSAASEQPGADRHRWAGDDDHHRAVRIVGSANAFGADLGWLRAPCSSRRRRRQRRRVRRRLLDLRDPDRPLRCLLPGALTAAIVWQAPAAGRDRLRRVASSRATDVTYGAFALVLGLLAWIFLAALALVLSAELDVVRYKRLYPRSLLTPFTDNVELTLADRRTYTDIATAQQAKGFESVSVRFGRRRRRREATTRGGHRSQRAAPASADVSSGGEVGFKPTDHLAAVNALAGCPIRPLRHLSGAAAVYQRSAGRAAGCRHARLSLRCRRLPFLHGCCGLMTTRARPGRLSRTTAKRGQRSR